MQKIVSAFIPVLLLLAVSLKIFVYCTNNNEIKGESGDLPLIRGKLIGQNDEFEKKVLELTKAVEQNENTEQQKAIFAELRKSYKKIEWAVEYFLPHSARFINGPPLPEIEFAEHIEIEPEGLQVLEELIYEDDAENKDEKIRMLKKLLNKTGTVRTNFKAITMNRAQIFDALRMEVFLVNSLSLAGFDSPASGNQLKEITVVLESVHDYLKEIDTGENGDSFSKIDKLVKDALSTLNKNSDPLNFNFLAFITDHLNPISSSLIDFKKENGIEDIAVQTALSKSARTFYDKNAFDTDAFVPGDAYKFSKEKADFGKLLFHDPILSKDQNRSCATCHHPDKAFTDGLARSLSLEENPLHRNTPSLNYAALQHGQFWDMRSEDLEGQSSQVITNKDEMHGDLTEIIHRISKNEKYRKLFRTIYKTHKAETWQLQNLLASYIRSLAVFNSDFDRYMRGEKSALNEDQKAGFNLFVGKAKCATCHFLPLFNGTVPPRYAKMEQEVLGTAEDFTNRRMDSDPGRGRFHETVAFLQHSFKTPTVRNVRKTAPYMHNGGYNTLQQVMDFYNIGGGRGAGFLLENQTLPEDRLDLSQKEMNQIIEFMHALDDK